MKRTMESWNSWGTGSSSSGPPFRPKVISKPNCDHDLPTDILTSHTEQDFRRRYFTCSIRKWDDREYIQWIDEPLPTSYCRNHCDRKLKVEREKYEKELLSHQLKIKTQECELLNVKVEKANVEAKIQKKKSLCCDARGCACCCCRIFCM